IFAAMGLIGVVARMRAPLQPPVATQLGAVREALRDHVVVLVEPERARLGQSLADQVVASLDVLCSYESYHLMRYDQGLSQDEATAAMTTGVIRLLA
ncbi:MAG TPA: hypothetical protein PLV68_05245, partial [Ilumatobacteraceae bacterium]|nr:hypothetical protein [Ilumatobacteraceae bacterium]